MMDITTNWKLLNKKSTTFTTSTLLLKENLNTTQKLHESVQPKTSLKTLHQVPETLDEMKNGKFATL